MKPFHFNSKYTKAVNLRLLSYKVRLFSLVSKVRTSSSEIGMEVDSVLVSNPEHIHIGIGIHVFKKVLNKFSSVIKFTLKNNFHFIKIGILSLIFHMAMSTLHCWVLWVLRLEKNHDQDFNHNLKVKLLRFRVSHCSPF